jgi:hypothetical protein
MADNVPFALTYIPQAAVLPAWLSYTSSPTLTSTALYTVPTLDPNGSPTLLTGEVVLTLFGTQIIQLPLTVDVTYSVAAPYTTADGSGPTIGSVLGATGTRGAFTLSASRILAGAESSSGDSTPGAMQMSAETSTLGSLFALGDGKLTPRMFDSDDRSDSQHDERNISKQLCSTWCSHKCKRYCSCFGLYIARRIYQRSPERRFIW